MNTSIHDVLSIPYLFDLAPSIDPLEDISARSKYLQDSIYKVNTVLQNNSAISGNGSVYNVQNIARGIKTEKTF